MEDWKEYKLEEICTKITDGSHSSPKAQESGYPMFSVKDMLEYGFDYSKCKYISQEDYVILKHNGCVPQKGDVLVAKDGSYLKQIFVCKETKEEAILSSIAIFRPNSLVDSFFLNYLLKSPQVYNYIANNCVSGSALPRIVLKDFKAVKLPIPSIEIQKNIVAILKSLDDKIEVNRKINENLEQQAQALFKSWFVDFEPFKNGEFVESELGMIPKGWRVVDLQDVVTIKRGGSPRPIQAFLSISGYRWLKISDATACQSPYIYEIKEFIKESGLSKTVKLGAGSLVLSNSATPGIPKILGVDSCIHDGWLYFPQSQLSKYYLYMLFKEKRDYLLSQGNGSVFTNLKTDIVKTIKIAIPNEQIMSKFNIVIESLFILIEKKTIESRHLAELRDALLPKLMSGELIVNEIENYL